MTEEEARDWLRGKFDVPRETWRALEDYVALLLAESERQNLIAASTADHVWARHIVDSAQLALLAPIAGEWLDLGAGAGLPGLIVAALTDRPVTLVESRRKRIEFLRSASEVIGLAGRVAIAGSRVEALPARNFAAISARAFAPLDRLLSLGARFAGPETIWVLPKGRNAHAELDAARRSWQGVFALAPSVTDPESAIIVARNVRPRGSR